MAADDVEHVIGYWVIWQISHSPFWLGYAVVAHWLPFTLFAFYTGSLADRIDSRRLIQISQGMYILASLSWGALYLTHLLQLWHVALIIVLHGLAGVIFSPSSQLLIHHMVGEERLVSAISLNSSLRQIAIGIGPLISGFLMAVVGPGLGFLANALIYLPLAILMLRIPYGGVERAPESRRGERRGWRSTFEGLQTVRSSPTIVGLLFIVAVTSLILGNAFQALMPIFAERLQASPTGYSLLLSAHGVGAILGGAILGLIGSTHLRPLVVTAGALVWSFLLIIFASSTWFPLSLVSLFLVGVVYIIFASMGQSIVQAWAPPAVRGRVIGVYTFAANGLRAASGLIVGMMSSLLGAPLALVWSSGAIGLLVLAASILIRSLWHRDLSGG